MSIFNQDTTLSRCPLNASAIQDAINDRFKTTLSCHATEEQLEEKISDILQSIYYGVKAGSVPLDRKWRIDVSEFGINHLPDLFYEYAKKQSKQSIIDEHSRILHYVRKRFEEAGFTYEDDESGPGHVTTIYLSLPFDFDDAWPAAQRVFAHTVAADLVPVVPMAPPSPLLYVPSILSCDAPDDIEPDIVTDSAPRK
jgi:hypothetical protein